MNNYIEGAGYGASLIVYSEVCLTTVFGLCLFKCAVCLTTVSVHSSPTIGLTTVSVHSSPTIFTTAEAAEAMSHHIGF